MITKVSKIGELYQINNSETPLDITSLRELLKESSNVSNMNDWLDILDEKGNNEFELKTAEKGTVVNIYEVEYPTPSDPNKETQEMARAVDEYEDFITQNLFPGITPEDIIVTQREHKEDIKMGPGRFFNEKELREKGKRGSKEHWKEVLSWEFEEDVPYRGLPFTREEAEELNETLRILTEGKANVLFLPNLWNYLEYALEMLNICRQSFIDESKYKLPLFDSTIKKFEELVEEKKKRGISE